VVIAPAKIGPIRKSYEECVLVGVKRRGSRCVYIVFLEVGRYTEYQ
jgi:hypothetical protein